MLKYTHKNVLGENYESYISVKITKKKRINGLTWYEIMVSEADETLEEGLSLEEQSKNLGYIKAKAVFDKTDGDRIVIGSDTLVVKDGKLFGKPKNNEHL